MTELPPLFVATDSIYSADELGLPHRDVIGQGVMGYEDMRVRQRAAGANMSVDVGGGTAWVMGDESLAQPLYRCYNDATKNIAVTTADVTNPRVDMVVAEVRDATYSGAFNDWRLRVVAGTPTGGATLDNRTGAAALPNNAIILADILVPANDTTVGDAEIRDRRPYALPNVPPAPNNSVGSANRRDHVVMAPCSASVIAQGAQADFTNNDLDQTATLVYLPRRIVGATRIRWKYRQGATAIVGNYVIGIYDASGTKIVDTGSVAFAGAANSYQIRSETISATTLEAGAYYVLFGTDTSVGVVQFAGVALATAVGFQPCTVPNVSFSITTGGVTAPATILGLADAATQMNGDNLLQAIPLIALSVG